jgi:hypothetical protein
MSRFLHTLGVFPRHSFSESTRDAWWTTVLVFLLVGISNPSPALAQQYQRQMLTGWDFTQATDSLGWAPIHPLPSFGVKNGALVFTATAAVNICYSPAISIATAPLQRVEIRMKSDNAGLARVFWAPTPNGAAGFIGGDENDFVLVGDAAFHDYVLPIDTSSAQTIFGLRLDVPAGATVSIQSVALASLIEPSGAGVSPVWEFETDGDPMGWILYQGVADITASAAG